MAVYTDMRVVPATDSATCAMCGKAIPERPHYLTDGLHAYCSIECAGCATRTYPSAIVAHLGADWDKVELMSI